MSVFRGHILFVLTAFLPISLLLALSAETAPDRAEYRYYFENPEGAIRLEPGFTILLRVFDYLSLPPDISISIIIIFVIFAYLQAGFHIMDIKSSDSLFAILIFLFSVYVTPSLVQIRFGLAISLVVLGYANLSRSKSTSALLVLLGCSMHYSVAYFSLCLILAIFLHGALRRQGFKIFALFALAVLPTAIYKSLFSTEYLSNYYQIYFQSDYSNIVFSLSSIVFIALILAFALLKREVDVSSYLIAGGAGVLCLVIYSGFAVFHRLYFPVMLICFFHVLDETSKRIGRRRTQTLLFFPPLIFAPFIFYFTCTRLGLF